MELESVLYVCRELRKIILSNLNLETNEEKIESCVIGNCVVCVQRAMENLVKAKLRDE